MKDKTPDQLRTTYEYKTVQELLFKTKGRRATHRAAVTHAYAALIADLGSGQSHTVVGRPLPTVSPRQLRAAITRLQKMLDHDSQSAVNNASHTTRQESPEERV
jgi:hypothetical protein